MLACTTDIDLSGITRVKCCEFTSMNLLLIKI